MILAYNLRVTQVTTTLITLHEIYTSAILAAMTDAVVDVDFTSRSGESRIAIAEAAVITVSILAVIRKLFTERFFYFAKFAFICLRTDACGYIVCNRLC